MTLDLIFRSSGASVAKLGLRLTSKTHGFKLSSIKISKPYNSEQFPRNGTNIFVACAIGDSTAIIDFIMTCSIFDIRTFVSTPSSRRYLKSAPSVHLFP